MALRLSVFFLLVVLNATTNAQPIQILNDTSTAEGAKGETIAPQTYVVNRSDSNLQLFWKRGETEQPASWQNPGVCDKNACYNKTDSATFSLKPGDTGQLKINFYAYDKDFNGVTGSGELSIKIGLTGNQFLDAEEQTAYFAASTFSTGLNESSSAEMFKAYPNPVSDQLNLSFRKSGSHLVRLFNVLGKPVIEKEIRNQQGLLNMSTLDNGIYILRHKNNNGEEITKRIYKQ